MRIVSGPSSHWLVEPGGAIRLPRWAVRRDGALRPGVERLLRATRADSHPAAYHLTVLTTTACNLGCSYCFQNVSADPDRPFQPSRIPSRT